MKVLNDNYTKNLNIKDGPTIDTYPRKLFCEHCGSELEYEKSDLRIGAFGCAYLDCPLCGKDSSLDNGELILTADNVEFPTHFWHSSKETGAIDCCDGLTVKREIRKAIKFFRENKDADNWFTTYGNLYIIVYRCDGDENYYVVVSDSFYETFIPFETADY